MADGRSRQVVRLLRMAAGLLFLAGCGAAASSGTSTPGSDTGAMTGVHWHIQLDLYINGQRQIIPANVGIGSEYRSNSEFDPMMSMTSIHTHDDSGMIHWEVMSSAKPNGPSFTLGAFFKIWGKTFSATRLLDSTNGPTGRVRMTVNGKPNMEFDKYHIHDHDRVEIRYE